MKHIKPLLTTAGGTAGITGVTLLGIFLGTKETIDNKLGEVFIPSTYEEGWKTKIKLISDDFLKEIKNETDENKKIKALKDWCNKQKSSIINSAFQREDRDFINKVRKACVYTIRDELNWTELPRIDELNGEWDAKVKKITSESSNGKYKDLKERIDKQTDDKKKREALQVWCSNKYKESIVVVDKKGKEELIQKVKDLCTLTIEEKGKEELLKGNDDKEKWENNVNALKSHNESDSSPKLTERLKAIKKKAETESSKDKALEEQKAWCEFQYKKGYKGEKDNSWLLTQAFCKKRK